MRLPAGISFNPSAKLIERRERMGVPPVVGGPEQMMQSLMAYRNERVLFRRKCDFSGDNIISAYPPETIFPVYKNDVWWGDSWSALDYGRDFDFSKTFFEQFKELQNVVPREGTSVFNSVNCDYNGHTRESKNCYMNSLIYLCEDSHYNYWAVKDSDIVDCFLVNNSTLAYDCIDCDNVYNCVKLQDCFNCQDCYFSNQLIGCSNCIACSGLRKKEYHVLNEPVSKEEFEKLKAELLCGKRSGLEMGQELFDQMWSSAIHRSSQNLNSENVTGDHLLYCRNVEYSFDGQEAEDVFYSISFAESKDIMHCYSAGWPACELIYASAVSRGSQNIAFCYYTFYSSNLRYCDSSMSSNDSFGCIGLKRQNNCILNKPYSAHDYDQLLAKITEHMKETGEWGRFFPIELSTFAYNDTAAQQYYPLSRDEAIKLGYRWRDDESSSNIATKELPDIEIGQISDDICKNIFSCAVSGKPYKLIKQELDFYRKMNLPLPDLCPDERFKTRLKRRNPFQLFKRACCETGQELWTSFPPQKSERVCSEEHFVQNIL